jgi:four helix bundle protein
MKLASYRQLKVWQLGIQLTQDAYLLSRRFPKHEVYGLTSQLRRAALSVPANIAEGHARDSNKEFLHHISIALGSLAEVETMLTVAGNLGYCDASETAELFQHCDEEGKMLRGLQKTLKSRINPSP